MGVVAVTKRYTQETGRIDQDGNREYVTLYQVEVDSLEVTAREVLQAKIEDAIHLPRGEWEIDPKQAEAKSIASDFLGQTDWVTAGTEGVNVKDEWGQTSNEYAEIIGKEARRSEDPKLSLMWDVIITWRWMQIDKRWYVSVIPQIDREVVEDALLDLGYAAGANPTGVQIVIPGRMSANPEPGPIVNTALEVYDPPIERERNREIIRATRITNAPTDGMFDWEMAVNTDDVKLQLPVGFAPGRLTVQREYRFRPYELRVRSVNIAELRFNSRHYFRETWEIAVKRRSKPGNPSQADLIGQSGWRLDVMDAGTMQRINVGEADGRPVTITPGGAFSENDIRDGAAPNIRIPSTDGKPVTKPVLLNGQGRPMSDPRNHNNQPVFIRYVIYPNERAFATLPFLQAAGT